MYTAFRKSLNKKDKGFTLIELLVVIVIIGILAAIAIPIFLNQRKKAADSSVKSDVRSIATAVETYFTDSATYPALNSITYAGGVLTVAGGEIVRMSPNNTPVALGLNAAGNAFCVQVTSPKGSDPTDGYVWKSDQGGLQAAGSDCTGYAGVDMLA